MIPILVPQGAANDHMINVVVSLIKQLSNTQVERLNVIPWSSPVPVFGNWISAHVATMGINPSNREFVDNQGRELDGASRRLHTLSSLRLSRWSLARDHHVRLIAQSFLEYFSANPYDGWFKELDQIIAGANASFYSSFRAACHLDLIPFATSCKWTELSGEQRKKLTCMGAETLARVLEQSEIRILILNGESVVRNLCRIAAGSVIRKKMPDWELPRRNNIGVQGYSYRGMIQEVAGVPLGRRIHVLGFNHNIQSSFGVTKKVKCSISSWISRSANEILNETA